MVVMFAFSARVYAVLELDLCGVCLANLALHAFYTPRSGRVRSHGAHERCRWVCSRQINTEHTENGIARR